MFSFISDGMVVMLPFFDVRVSVLFRIVFVQYTLCSALGY